MPDTDISFVSNGRPSVDRIFPAFYDSEPNNRTPPRLSNFSEFDNNSSVESLQFGRRSVDIGSPPTFSSLSQESDGQSASSSSMVIEQIMIILIQQIKVQVMNNNVVEFLLKIIG